MTQRGSSSPILVTLILILVVVGLSLSVKNSSKESVKNSQSSLTYKIAYIKQDNDQLFKGQLWITNERGNNKRQLTKDEKVVHIHGWSNDNKFIAVTLENEDKHTIAAIDMDSGQIIKLKDVNYVHYPSQVFWFDDKRLIHLNGAEGVNSKGIVELISVPEGKGEILLSVYNTIPEISPELTSDYNLIKFSPDGEWLAFDIRNCCGGTINPKAGNVYAYNLKTKTKRRLTADDQDAVLLNWRGDRIIFYTHQPEEFVWEINPDGTGLTKLFQFDDNKDDYTTVNLTVSFDLNKLFYGVVSDGSIKGTYKYTLSDKAVKPLNMETISKGFDSRYVPITSLSSDGKVSAFRFPVYQDKEYKTVYVCFVKNIETGELIRITEENCNSPTFSN